jgi:hypothetical protein
MANPGHLPVALENKRMYRYEHSKTSGQKQEAGTGGNGIFRDTQIPIRRRSIRFESTAKS